MNRSRSLARIAAILCACASPTVAQTGVNATAVTAAQAPPPTPAGDRELVDRAWASMKAADFSAASTWARAALETLLARPLEEQDAGWLELVDSAGHAAYQCRDFATARSAYERVLEVRTRALPDEHLHLQWARGNLAGALQQLGDLPAARALQEKVLEVLELTVPEDHRDLQMARVALGQTLAELGEHALALELAEQALLVFERTLPGDHPDLQMVRLEVALSLENLGDLAAARTLQEQVIEAYERTRSAHDPNLLIARGNLAVTLHRLGELERARALQERVLDAYSRDWPPEHLDVQGAREDLASTLTALGELAAARTLQEQVLEVRSRALPDDHPGLQSARNNLAGTLYLLGDLAGARALQEKVLEIVSRVQPDDAPLLQVARGNLAMTLRSLGDLPAARLLDEKVLEVYSRTLPQQHRDVQWARGNLAATLYLLGEVQSASELFEQALAGLSHTFPEHHPEVQLARLNLALARKELGELRAAGALERQSLAVCGRTLADDHPDVQRARASLATTLAAEPAPDEDVRGEFARIARDLARAISTSARAAVLSASSREAEARCASSLGDLGLALTYAGGCGAFPRDAELERLAFVASEQSRGAALVSARLTSSARADPSYARLRAEMQHASAELAQLAQAGAKVDDLEQARLRRERAERTLLEHALDLAGADARALELDLLLLASQLDEHTALIAYRRYPRSVPTAGRVARSHPVETLCAFVLRAPERLALIDLGPLAPVEQLVESWRSTIGARFERGQSVGPEIEAESARRGAELRRSVLDPLLPALEGVQRIVVVLDDVLHLVPLDALPLAGAPAATAGSGDSRLALVGERWHIETRCTLTELLWKSDRPQASEALVALGGAAFNTAPQAFASEETPAPESSLPVDAAQRPALLRGGAWERGFPPLAYAGPEARAIAALYGEVFGDSRPAFVLEKSKASSAALAELAPRARFLHIATHGWFAPESVRAWNDSEPLDARLGWGAHLAGEERARGMNPMLLCGLALAGANLPADALGNVPGLLTAEEFSALDLQSCELAVLSSCDTNVGERRAGQGVASLQKALHMAGARSVITSLWKVPDEATQELMLDFYRRIWVEKKPKSVALWEAKHALYARRAPTRDWAAWVLTGDPD